MIHGWAGFRNFKYLFEDPALLNSLMISVIIVVGVIAITIVFGTILAAVFNQPFRGQGFARVLMISPFFVMPTVSALVWKNLLLDPVNGLVAAIFRMVGLQPVAWFSVFPLGSIMAILCWEWLPYAFLILFTALQSMDEEQLEAARLDGASAVDIFLNIQLPHMSRAISVTIMIEMIFLLGVFAEIYVTTGGRPRLRHHQPDLPDLSARAPGLQCRRRFGRRRHRHRARQYRLRLPHAERRQEA